MATQTRARVLRFGFDPSCDVSAYDMALDGPHGTRFQLRTPDKTVPMRVWLAGRNMIYPILMGSLDAPPKPQRVYYREVGEHIARVADRVLIIGNEFDQYRPGLRSGSLPESAVC